MSLPSHARPAQWWPAVASIGGTALIRNLILTAFVAISMASASAATVDDITMPDARMINGRQLVLNGMGERTYSILGIRIYVAALYLEQRSHDAEAILRSPET